MGPTTDELALILRSVTELNAQLPPEDRVALSADAVLVGDAGTLDSLALINLFVVVEEKVEAELGVYVPLVDALAEEEGETFATVGHLADWISQRRSG